MRLLVLVCTCVLAVEAPWPATAAPPPTLTAATDRSAYRVGEQVHLTLTADRNAYVYVYNEDREGKLTLFLPNPVEEDCRLRAGIPRRYPDPQVQARYGGQYNVEAVEPVGKEAFHCLATRYPLPDALPEKLTTRAELDEAAEEYEGVVVVVRYETVRPAAPSSARAKPGAGPQAKPRHAPARNLPEREAVTKGQCAGKS